MLLLLFFLCCCSMEGIYKTEKRNSPQGQILNKNHYYDLEYAARHNGMVFKNKTWFPKAVWQLWGGRAFGLKEQLVFIYFVFQNLGKCCPFDMQSELQVKEEHFRLLSWKSGALCQHLKAPPGSLRPLQWSCSTSNNLTFFFLIFTKYHHLKSFVYFF